MAREAGTFFAVGATARALSVTPGGAEGGACVIFIFKS